MARIIPIKSFAHQPQQLVNVTRALLKNDCVIAVPTDTVYGLAASAHSRVAIERLFAIKERDHSKTSAICLGDLDQVAEYGQLTISRELLAELLPGAVTLFFKQSPEHRLNEYLSSSNELVGVRIPDHDFIRDVCRKFGPLALTSANISAQASCSEISEFSELWPKLDAIFDGGRLGEIDPDRLGSTIVDLSVPGKYRIVRDGCIYQHVVHLLNKHGLEKIS